MVRETNLMAADDLRHWVLDQKPDMIQDIRPYKTVMRYYNRSGFGLVSDKDTLRQVRTVHQQGAIRGEPIQFKDALTRVAHWIDAEMFRKTSKGKHLSPGSYELLCLEEDAAEIQMLQEEWKEGLPKKAQEPKPIQDIAPVVPAYLDTEKQKVVALAQLPSEASLENLLEIAGDTDRAGRVRDPGASVVANCPGYPTESLELTLLGQSVTNSGDVLVIVKDTAGQQEGRCNGFVGLVNPTSWGPVGRTWLCRGDRFEFATWEDGATGVLIVGSNLWIGENGEETGTAPLLLKQSASGLTRITRLPPSARTCGLELPSDEDFFTEGSPYWEDHRIAPIDGGFLLLERSGEGWQEMGFVPVSLAEPYAAPVAECWYDEEQLGHAAGEWYWMKEYPGWSFLVKDGSLTLRNGLEVFWEQDHLRNLYASDLDGDGTAELCMTVSEADSSWIQVVSLKDGDLPCISLVGNMDWTLVVEEGALRVRGSLDGVSFTGVPVLENGKLTVKIPQPNGGTLIADLTEEAEAEMAPQSGHQEVTWEVSGNSSDTGIFSIGKSGTT